MSKWTPEQLAEKEHAFQIIREKTVKAAEWLCLIIDDAMDVQKQGKAFNAGKFPAELHMKAAEQLLNRGGIPVKTDMEFVGDNLPLTLVKYEGIPEAWSKAPEVTAH